MGESGSPSCTTSTNSAEDLSCLYPSSHGVLQVNLNGNALLHDFIPEFDSANGRFIEVNAATTSTTATGDVDNVNDLIGSDFLMFPPEHLFSEEVSCDGNLETEVVCAPYAASMDLKQHTINSLPEEKYESMHASSTSGSLRRFDFDGYLKQDAMFCGNGRPNDDNETDGGICMNNERRKQGLKSCEAKSQIPELLTVMTVVHEPSVSSHEQVALNLHANSRQSSSSSGMQTNSDSEDLSTQSLLDFNGKIRKNSTLYKPRTGRETKKTATNSFIRKSKTLPQAELLFTDRRHYSQGDSNSKNAIAARENRLKKKQYVSNLEEKVSKIEAENKTLHQECQKNRGLVRSLREEVEYYKSIIANQTTLSAVLKNVLRTPGVKLTTSFTLGNENFNPSVLEHGSKKFSKSASSNECPTQTPSSGNSQKLHRKISTLTSAGIKRSFRSVTSGMTTRSSKSSLFSKGQKRMCNTAVNTEEVKDSHTNSSMLLSEDEEIDVDSVPCPGGSGSPSPTLSEDASAVNDRPGGICLHVSGQAVSLEFCTHCSTRAKSSVLSDHSYIRG